MFPLRVLSLLCWASLCGSAPLTCERLVRPLDALDPRGLGGRWVMVAGGLSDPAHEEHFRSRDSAVIHFSNSSSSSSISFKRAFAFGDDCSYLRSEFSLDGAGFTLHGVNLTVTFVQAPRPDCLATHFNSTSNRVRRLYLFCREREVEQVEMELFQAQAKCFNLGPVVAMDPSKRLCPVEPPAGAEADEEQKAA